jgi:hypothetical protein
VCQATSRYLSLLHPAKECRNGRLPRITQRDAFTHGIRFAYTRTIELRADGPFPGAAWFHALRPD